MRILQVKDVDNARFDRVVQILGRHTESRELCNLLIGNPPHVEGQLVRAVRVALAEGIDTLHVGTGASRWTPRAASLWSGAVAAPAVPFETLEVDVMLHVLEANLDTMASFASLAGFDLRAWFARLVVVRDACARNTEEELKSIGKYRRHFIVTSASHMPRSAIFCAQLLDRLESAKPLVTLTPSDTCFAGTRPGKVVAFEPPHRGDHHAAIQPHDLAKLLLRAFLNGAGAEFATAFIQLVEPYGASLDLAKLAQTKPLTADALRD